MKTIWILGDQLSPTHAGLSVAEKGRDPVLMIESKARGAFMRYHQQKLVLVYSAMRHFAEELRAAGWTVDYFRVEENLKFEEAVQRHIDRYAPHEMILAQPNSFIETEAVGKICRKLALTLRLIPTTQFICNREEFAEQVTGKTRLLMEHHYRRVRRKTGYLMRGEEPEGEQWNFDSDNRLTLIDWKKERLPLPPPLPKMEPDAITREVIDVVKREFWEHPGRAEDLWVPVNREESLRWLENFIEHRLPRFGDFEDLMLADQPTLFHSVLSPMLNLGLLTPQECVEAAITAYRAKRVPLNAVEGFVRQIIGWREFIHGTYWIRGPHYRDLNSLRAVRPLPAWFYTGDTPMNCLHQVLRQTLALAWNHHIQRLMVIGNFVLLAGIRPQEALGWYLEMYIDAFDWVMMANVIGLVCHADGGLVATKPYAASAAYIHRMSNYCEGCRFNPKEKTGPNACPFNYLYWNFYDTHGDRFLKNQRTSFPVQTWKKRPLEEKNRVRSDAARFLDEHVPLNVARCEGGKV